MRRIQAIDSHTEGEPTRVVLEGGPQRCGENLADWLQHLRANEDAFRSAVVNEPRGNDAIVGALLYEPFDDSCELGVVYFNNAGWLNMCVHGSIGLMATLAHAGRLRDQTLRVETPEGPITCTLDGQHRVTVENVASRCSQRQLALEVPGYGAVTGDVAWGGNWFFLVDDHRQHIRYDNLERLTHCAWSIRRALDRERITGDDGRRIDHIELFGPPLREDADSKNFVLCPGGAYDRSPCGTGTSAKLACLHAAGRLAPGEVWRQESILGTLFEGAFSGAGPAIAPRITGSAYVNAELNLLLDPHDPFQYGIRQTQRPKNES